MRHVQIISRATNEIVYTADVTDWPDRSVADLIAGLRLDFAHAHTGLWLDFAHGHNADDYDIRETSQP